MSKKFKATKQLTIHAPLAVVWKALTDPAMLKQYFFGTDLHTSWQPGSPIRFTGEWEGTPYEDKGTVLQYEAEKRLQYDYLSSWSGEADVPENYQLITYRVQSKGTGTLLTITQSRIATLEKKIHSMQSWGMLMQNLKALVERG